MTDDIWLPEISAFFEFPTRDYNNFLYQDLVRNMLKKILSSDYFQLDHNNPNHLNKMYEKINKTLPIMTSSTPEDVPSNMSFFLLIKYRPNAFKFFFEMISRWLVPGKRLNVLLIYATDFYMPELSNDIYTICEIMINIENRNEFEEIKRNLPIIETEVKLGVVSNYYAHRILEVKGLSSDEKTAMIQETIDYLIQRRNKIFDHDVFTEMQHVLVMCTDAFKEARSSRHLTRIISYQYLFRKEIQKAVKKNSEKRHLSLKIFRTNIKQSFGSKEILGVIVGFNFLRDKEVFEKKHFLEAIQNHISQARAIDNSYFTNRRGNEQICTLYLEIEKANGEKFTGQEIVSLRKKLPNDLEDRIEHLLHPVFMPRNEEEIMRNILSLSNQIKYVRDIPQVFISFDEQTHTQLYFTVILVRVVKPDSISIQKMFKETNSYMEYIHDRCRIVGVLRKKYKKEATVFRLKLPKDKFIRRNHTIDLNKARQSVVNELSIVMKGKFRDFNGGMISKQNENLCCLRENLSDTSKYNDLLLENFFYSITPVIMRTVLDPEVLKTLFMMLLEAISEGLYAEENMTMKTRIEQEFVFIMLSAVDRKIKERVENSIMQYRIHSTSLTSSCIHVYDNHYLGYIYRADDPMKQQQFCHFMESLVEECEELAKV